MPWPTVLSAKPIIRAIASCVRGSGMGLDYLGVCWAPLTGGTILSHSVMQGYWDLKDAIFRKADPADDSDRLFYFPGPIGVWHRDDCFSSGLRNRAAEYSSLGDSTLATMVEFPLLTTLLEQCH